MRTNSGKKIITLIAAIAFICAAFLPTVHSSVGRVSVSQQSQTTTPNVFQETLTNLIDIHEAAISKVSPPNNPLPLDTNPPNVHLPPGQVTMKVFSSTTSYFRTQLFNVPAGYEVSNGNYTGWCTDSAHTINTNTAYQVTLYSSYNTSLPTHLYHQNWSKVNYIINHKVGTDWHQVGYAILYIMDFGNQGLNSNGWSMVNDAIAYGGSYIPDCGDRIAIIADVSPTVQRTVFELTLPAYTLSVSTNGQGSVELDPQETGYTYGEEVQLTAIPDPGWSFSQWGGDLSGSTNPATVTMTGNKVVTATFTQCIYTLSIGVDPVAGGSVGAVPSPPYYYGDVVTLTAVANAGYSFGYWSGDASGGNPVTTVTMTGDKSVVAHFTQDVYTLSIGVDPVVGGSVGVDPVGPYYYGDVVTLTAVANAGYSFGYWSGDASGTDPETTITMNGNKTVTASFEFTGNDTIPPTIEIITPTNAIYIFNKFIIPYKTPIIVQMITFEANATDHETGIDYVEFFVDGISKGNDTSEPYTYDWRELRSGKHTVQMKAYDKAGNTATTEELLVFKWRLHPILIVPILLLGYLWARENP